MHVAVLGYNVAYYTGTETFSLLCFLNQCQYVRIFMACFVCFTDFSEKKIIFLGFFLFMRTVFTFSVAVGLHAVLYFFTLHFSNKLFSKSHPVSALLLGLCLF